MEYPLTEPFLENIAVPPSALALAEAEVLSSEIFRDIELSQIPLSLVALKALRLARIINDFEAQQIFEWESGGYPREADGVSNNVWLMGIKAERIFYSRKTSGEAPVQRMYSNSIEELENRRETGMIGLQGAAHPGERGLLTSHIATYSERIASRRTFIYNYVSRKYYELKFGSVADDVIARIRSSVDGLIGHVVPDAVKMFTAIYDNLKSGNPEDWANAVHGCRRVLQALADEVVPAQGEPRVVIVKGEETTIKLGADQYINRLIAYIDNSSESERFSELVGSELQYMGDRLDALFKAAQKGSHATVSKEEADRCVVYTYLTVGDILSLGSEQPQSFQFEDVFESDSSSLEQAEDWDVTIDC